MSIFAMTVHPLRSRQRGTVIVSLVKATKGEAKSLKFLSLNFVLFADFLDGVKMIVTIQRYEEI
ncbi:MAG: hypothetical protein DYG83_16220 [Candidatus Brocadia sp. AMX2]|uniref:Uncharacterized protein n=1 Tax=Candidatus Brocadia sinica JPN1 TaxID=1197129 RepID=A0ABQ0K1Q2_9BACT|nr:MAG: hypothetical protein EDM70_14530 [Candidatus Brocadia sp. AMX2]MBC6934096.1 hypothetical protein [Candidatus Brocadia sp.]MBL1170561.1 hypothetical protein [Candidatus Brocadia sp. AMX1]GAN34665.1 hypothetical protein BROSI_A3208 [Candidatus Brocadia sinica JPN1]GIK11689.1 MAG: hypothetical protein BroJett002_03960 [Candidatus Brocadia sinica]